LHKNQLDKDATLRALGAAIRSRRLAKSLSQSELAHLLDTDQGYIARLESGDSNISIFGLKRVAHALGVTIHAITTKADL
jgi:transcriptional regulator with XRE-family HTH domain